MDAKFIAALADIVERSQLVELEYSCEGQRIRLARTGSISAVAQTQAAAPAAQPTDAVASVNAPAPAAPAERSKEHIPAGLNGVFYTSPTPNDAPFVKVGDTVSEGQTLALIEAMKMLHPIESPHTGVITDILVENGVLVSPDTALFAIKQG